MMPWKMARGLNERTRERTGWLKHSDTDLDAEALRLNQEGLCLVPRVEDWFALLGSNQQSSTDSAAWCWLHPLLWIPLIIGD